MTRAGLSPGIGLAAAVFDGAARGEIAGNRAQQFEHGFARPSGDERATGTRPESSRPPAQCGQEAMRLFAEAAEESTPCKRVATRPAGQ
jgi:hypothetical protein